MVYLGVGTAAGAASLMGTQDYSIAIIVGAAIGIAAFEAMDYRTRRKPSPGRFHCAHCLRAFEQ